MTTVYSNWKKYLETNKPSALDMAVYAIARSIGNKDPISKASHLLYSGFTPVKNTTKLINGTRPHQALFELVGFDPAYAWGHNYKLKRITQVLETVFEIEVTEEIKKMIHELGTEIFQAQSIPYSYVVVRGDLSPAQRVVQSCHAIQEITMQYPTTHENTHMVVLKVDSEIELKQVEKELARHKRAVKFHTFYESDEIGHTAIATAPVTYNYVRRLFSKYALLN